MIEKSPQKLPFYAEDVAKFRPKVEKVEKPCKMQQSLEETFDSVGKQIDSLYVTYENDVNYVKEKFETGVAHASDTLSYLRQEESDLPRAGAVALAGMTGFILGLRGGFFKKLIYTSVSAGGMAALCYPKEAVVISKDVVINAKKYASIGYNFVQGAKPGEEIQPIPIIKAPAEPAKKKDIKGDMGQSNPDDKDMYTTRS